MRSFLILSVVSRILASTAALLLAVPPALAQNVDAAAQAGEAVPAAGSRDERDECKLVTVSRGEGAKLVEEKSSDSGREFPFLMSQRDLDPEFRIDEDALRPCVVAFGLPWAGPGAAPAAVGAAAAGAAPGAGLAGVGAAGIGAVGGPVVAGALGAAAAAAAAVGLQAISKGNQSSPANSP